MLVFQRFSIFLLLYTLCFWVTDERVLAASVAKTANQSDCGVICQFQTQMMEQPILFYLVAGGLILILITLFARLFLALRGKKIQPPSPAAVGIRSQPSSTYARGNKSTMIYDYNTDPIEEIYSSPRPVTPPSYNADPADPIEEIYSSPNRVTPPSHNADPIDEIYSSSNPTVPDMSVPPPPTPVQTPKPIETKETLPPMQMPHAHLEVISTPNLLLLGKRVEIDTFPCTIGREDSDIVIEDGRISRKHARISVEESGRFTVSDLGSSNGVFIDGDRIEPNREIPITTNQAIKLSLGGRTHLLFYAYD